MTRSLLLKALIVGALALILMVPITMIQGLVAERQSRATEALAGIAEGWGKRQTVAGPYLVIPYERRWTEVEKTTVDGKQSEKRAEHMQTSALRLPATTLDWQGDGDNGQNARGLYKEPLYLAVL